MARDAQLSGDRVNTEYYLQFADHYFRVLADQRGRFEEQGRDRRPRDDFDNDEDFGDEGEMARAEDQRQQQPRRDDGRREERGERNPRERNFNRRDEAPRYAEADRSDDGAPAPVAAAEMAGEPTTETIADEAPRPRRGRPRRVAAETEAIEVMDAERLPPSLGIVPIEGVIASEGEPVEAPKPRTRRRRTTDVEASAG